MRREKKNTIFKDNKSRNNLATGLSFVNKTSLENKDKSADKSTMVIGKKFKEAK